MTTLIGASVFVDQSEITHHVTDGNPVLIFGPYPTVRRVDVHLGDRATIHAVIAHLVALEQEMDPPGPGCDCTADAPAPAAERQLDVIAALTENDVRAMDGHDVTVNVLNALDRGQLCSLLRFLAGYEPRGFAKAVLQVADVNFAPPGGGVLLPAGCDPDTAARGELCHYCDVEPATVTLTNGRYCEACAPGVQLATGADVAEPALSLTPKGLAALDDAALAPAAPRVIRSAALPGGAA